MDDARGIPDEALENEAIPSEIPADPAEVIEALDQMRALAEAATAAALDLVSACDARGLWEADGATSMTAWLAARYKLTKSTAREWVRVARALGALPAIRRAHARGELSWDQLRPLTRFATAESDAALARTAPRRSPASLWWEAERHRKVTDRQVRDAYRRRFLDLWRDEEQCLYLNGMLPPEQGAAVEAALSRRAQEVTVEEGLPDPQGARMADAFVELATRDDAAPPTLVVHTDAAVLAAREGPPTLAETSSGVRLSPEAVRRLACDAAVEWVVESDGRPVGVGRRSRSVPGWLSRLLQHRDRGCRFPGCERSRWLRAHHIWHWADGGPTDLDNLVLLCHTHHRLLHEGRWRTSGHPGSELRFHRPDGAPLRRSPPALRSEIRARFFP